MNKEPQKIEKLFKLFVRQKPYRFPRRGYVESVGVPNKQGVYIIYDPKNIVVHVGRTQRGKNGLRQRLNNHLLGQSSFVEQYLKGQGSRLRKGYTFKCIVEKNPRIRALLEVFTIGKLCPKHIGLGLLRD